jgi:hypothetical protein
VDVRHSSGGAAAWKQKRSTGAASNSLGLDCEVVCAILAAALDYDETDQLQQAFRWHRLASMAMPNPQGPSGGQPEARLLQ